MCGSNFYESDVKWKSKYQFECHIAATKQQRTLNFELVVSDQLFSVFLVAYN